MVKLLVVALLILGVAIDGARADAMVSGTVYCDQCKDGRLSMFDYPINGIKVTVACANKEGQITMSREETTNWFGTYAMRFEGTPDLTNCYAQVSPNQQQQQGCAVATGPAQSLRLMFRMLEMEMYAVDSLLSQPAQPMSFCPKASSPPSTSPPTNTAPPQLPPPVFKLPPPSPLPPAAPFLDASACPHEMWMMGEYKCYWRVVNPDTKAALVFGPVAARKYGTRLTLMESLQGRGDPYRTLLREATTALLNSYNSIPFQYHTISVIQHTNSALMGSTRDVLVTALRFKRANSGYGGRVTCKFTTCK